MSRVVLALLIAAPVSADPAPAAPAMSDQALGADLGVATGGRVAVGGLRVAGHYLYQLAASDWFDGTASFTFGGGTAACFRDRADTFICDHGLAQGGSAEIEAAVRHFFAAQGQFRPFLRGGLGLRYVRFGNDSVSGAAIPLHLGGGVRVTLGEGASTGIAVTVQGALELGVGAFSHSLGLEPQLGVAITAGVEFGL
ncbi:hypothetical protein BH11MYX1_BH11MYX1_47060 [soil metagenome]